MVVLVVFRLPPTFEPAADSSTQPSVEAIDVYALTAHLKVWALSVEVEARLTAAGRLMLFTTPAGMVTVAVHSSLLMAVIVTV